MTIQGVNVEDRTCYEDRFPDVDYEPLDVAITRLREAAEGMIAPCLEVHDGVICVSGRRAMTEAEVLAWSGDQARRQRYDAWVKAFPG